MDVVLSGNIALHVRQDGDPEGTPILFSNSLGTDMRIWDAVISGLPNGLRIVRYDIRGHGLSDCPPGPYSVSDLTADAAAIIEKLGCGPVIFVGLSIGGMTGQLLAATRPDLVRALVLSNTATKMGTPEMWADRIEAIRKDGLAAMESAILDRWFGPAFRSDPITRLCGSMLTRTPQNGYLACCAAIAAADLTQSTASLRVPTVAIAGSDDRASSAEIVAQTAALIPGTPCHTIEGSGHLPCVENPAAYAAILTSFIKEHANV